MAKSLAERAAELAAERENAEEARRIRLENLQNEPISDELIVNSVKAFKLVLESVTDVFGLENMTEGTMQKAIEEAGYIAWRGIMGQKDDNPRR